MKRFLTFFMLLNLGAFIGVLCSWWLAAGDQPFSDVFTGFILYPILLLIAFGRLLGYGTAIIVLMLVGLFVLALVPFLPLRGKYIAVVISMALINLKTVDALIVAMSA